MSYLTAAILILTLFYGPLRAQADFVTPILAPAAFENQQNLVLEAQIIPTDSSSSTALTDNGTFGLPINAPLSISYSITHAPLWPSRNVTSVVNDDLFKETLAENQLYLELWEGTPFSSTAHFEQSWNITGSSTGKVSTVFAETGPHFLVAYLPDGFYQDPKTACPNDDNWQIDCAPPYSLEQMREYFMSSLDSISSEPFPYMPDAFGGVGFSVTGQTSTGSNVLFIPGTLTSRLYTKNADGSERDLWEPHSNLDIAPLAMNADGISEQTIYTRDIIDQLYSNDTTYHTALHLALKKDSDVYSSFKTFMDSLVANHTIKEWRAYPYDWRYDVRDIVSDGTLVGTATTSPVRIYLQDVVQELASTSPTGKVTIIAHSNGGLIAKALAIDLAQKNKLGLIDKIIMVGTPQLGTPKSITDLLHGDEFTQLGGLIMYSDTVRDTEATMPGAYDLLPSPGYFSLIPDPVVTFDSNDPALQFRNAIGAIIHSFSQLSDFLSDAFHLDAGAGLAGSTKTPIPLSLALITKAQTTHDILDAWTPPQGLDVTVLAGWGQLTQFQETYSGTSGLNCDRTSFFVPLACSLLPQLQPEASYSENGDDTVIAGSAAGKIFNSFYLNTKDFRKDTGTNVVHSSLLAATPVQSALTNLIKGAPIDSPYVSATIPTDETPSLIVVSAHSPVNLLATDAEGNETGIVPVPELPGIYFQKEDIPGSSVQVIGEEKYLYLPQHLPFQISMIGYDTGTTTIDIDEIDSEGSTTRLQEFPNLPTTASTSILFTLEADGSVSSSLSSLGDQVSPTTSTSSSADVNQESTRSLPEKKILPTSLTTTSTTTSLIQFTELVFQLKTHLPELIKAMITITSTQRRWIMYSTVWISFLASL